MTAALISRLENWSRYFRDRPRYGKAGSAEGNYRSPSPDYSAIIELFPELKDALEAPRARGQAPDPLDAQLIQDAVKRLPERHRLCLSMWHIRLLPAPRIERMLRLGTRGFELCYFGALRELDYELARNMNKSTYMEAHKVTYSIAL